MSRSSAAAFAVALTTLSPAVAWAAAAPKATPSPAPGTHLRPTFVGARTLGQQMAVAGDRLATHRRLVAEYVDLAGRAAEARGTRAPRGLARRAGAWTNPTLKHRTAGLRGQLATPSGDGRLATIRMCESHGNYATNTGNGFYGAYQFDLGTWRSVGGSGLPSDAPPAEQDRRATMLLNRSGSSPWPVCGV